MLSLQPIVVTNQISSYTIEQQHRYTITTLHFASVNLNCDKNINELLYRKVKNSC